MRALLLHSSGYGVEGPIILASTQGLAVLLAALFLGKMDIATVAWLNAQVPMAGHHHYPGKCASGAMQGRERILYFSMFIFRILGWTGWEGQLYISRLLRLIPTHLIS